MNADRGGYVTEIRYRGRKRVYVFTVDFPSTGGIKGRGPFGLIAFGRCYQTLVHDIYKVVDSFEYPQEEIA